MRRSVIRVEKFTGANVKILKQNINQQPMGIVIWANDTNDCKFYFVIGIEKQGDLENSQIL